MLHQYISNLSLEVKRLFFYMYRMAHKKTAAEKFSYKLQVPLTPAQHKVLEAAAKTEGLALASWVRQVVLRAVRTEAQ